jgi:hypothetical protein
VVRRGGSSVICGPLRHLAAGGSQAIALEAVASELQAKARQLLGANFAGFWIEHTPSFGFVVAGVGDHAAEVRGWVAGTELEALTSYVEADRSETDLLELADSVASEIKVPFDQSIDVRRNEVVVIMAAENASRLAEPHRAGVRTEYVDELSKPAAQIYGGVYLSSCTAGFSVYHPGSNKYGILTAGHCPNTQSYQGTTLPLQGAYYYLTVDAQWHTTPGFTDAPKFKTSEANTRLVTGWITSVRSRSA